MVSKRVSTNLLRIYSVFWKDLGEEWGALGDVVWGLF